MLVPAIAFAWWVVSMAPPAHGAADRSAPTARASADTDDTDSSDDTAYDAPAPAAPAAPATPDDADDDGSEYNAEKRVPVKLITPEIVSAARSFLKVLQDLPLGAERSAMLGGKRYAFVLERHYHPLDFVGGPRGWHKGVTVYEYR